MKQVEDHFTNTVDAAAYWAEKNAEDNYKEDYDFECFDEMDIPVKDDEDDCNCSDPGCPCRGNKIGEL